MIWSGTRGSNTKYATEPETTHGGWILTTIMVGGCAVTIAARFGRGVTVGIVLLSGGIST